MKTINIQIKGITPLLMDAIPIDAIIALRGLEPKRRGHGAMQTISADKLLYQNGHGLYIPFNNIFACIINVSGQFKEPGKRGGSYSKSLAGAMSIMEDEIPFTPSKWKQECIFGRTVRKKDGNRVWKENPIFPEWSLEFHIRLADWFNPEVLKEILIEAGQVEGLGGWRPARKGRFGQFEVKKFEVN